MARLLSQQGFLTPWLLWCSALLGADPSTCQKVSIIPKHCGVQACAPVSSTSTKFQCSLVALHFCIDDISLIFFQISFIVVKYTQNALSSPLMCKTLCILIVVQLPLLSGLGHVVCGHSGEYAYTLHRLPWTSHSQGRLSAFCYCVKCPGESNSVEKGFILAQSCSSTVCHDRSQAGRNLLALCAAVTRATMHAC